MGLGSHKDAGCFLIGSGPSLKDIDVTQLAQLDTISFNRSYIAWKQWGFAPTYYACLDPVVFEDNALEIQQLIEEYPRTHFFLPDSARHVGIKPSAQVALIKLTSGNMFSTNISLLTDFGNVGATSIQILSFLGYHRIAMVGVDARYSPLNISAAMVDKNGFALVWDDPNHFCPEYTRGKRSKAHPDFENTLGQWPQVAKECSNHEMEVRNASSGSALDCFPTTDFWSAIEWIQTINKENYDKLAYL